MEKSPFIWISVGVDILSSIFFPMTFRNPETRVCWLEAAVDRKQHRFPCPRISVAPYEINVFEVMRGYYFLFNLIQYPNRLVIGVHAKPSSFGIQQAKLVTKLGTSHGTWRH